MLEYIESKKLRETENTFTPTISKQSLNLCKDRDTMSKAKGGKSKVKPVLFDALHMDAGQRIK